jgi:Uma2 family endonuclease
MIMKVFNPDYTEALIRERKRLGIDRKDEVWDGVYIIMPDPTIVHQRLVLEFSSIFAQTTKALGIGEAFPGTNVSDRRDGWEHNFRAPDVVVVLHGSRAVDCGTHWFGGPDLLVEIQSPGDETDAKTPFYGELGVRELMIVHSDTRDLRLYRHDGKGLVPVVPSDFRGQKWLVSEVLPLAFRRTTVKGQGPRTEVRRTDGARGKWVV